MILVKLKKKSGYGTASKEKRIFAPNFRKIVGWIKAIVKVREKILLKPLE